MLRLFLKRKGPLGIGSLFSFLVTWSLYLVVWQQCKGKKKKINGVNFYRKFFIPEIFYTFVSHCGIEQWSAREPHKLQVVGSNPSSATNFKKGGYHDVKPIIKRHEDTEKEG